RVRPRRARRRAGDVRPAAGPHRGVPRVGAPTTSMTEALLIIAAVLLVALGGLMAALDAALTVTSRADLADLAVTARNPVPLNRIASDPDAHDDAVVFIRIMAETTAAVLITVAFTLLFESLWWAMLAAAVLMTAVSF